MKSLNFGIEKDYWDKGYLVAGVDEVGRGAWAGPIVAAAVCFAAAPQIQRSKFKDQNFGIIINDSKKMTAKERERAARWIYRYCMAFGIGEVDVTTINKIGIGKANRLAMKRAINNCKFQIANRKSTFKISNIYYLVDGYRVKYLARNQKGIIKGDGKCFSIAAASIVAKVYRDKLMGVLGKSYKKYGWKNNKGYGTVFHQKAVIKTGICKYHRTQFIRTFLLKYKNGI